MSSLPLSEVGIDGFRGLRSLELEGLGRINILVGSNNSGKTSVLEALSILCQPFNPEEWLNMVRRRDFGQLDETRLQSLRWCFTQASGAPDPEQFIQTACEFKLLGKLPLRGLRVEYKEFVGEPSPDEMSHRLSGFIPPKSLFNESNDESDKVMRGAELVYVPDFLQKDLFHEAQLADESLRLRVWERIATARFGKDISREKLDSETLTPYSYQTNRNQVRSRSKLIFQQDSPSVLELVRDFDIDVEGIEIASFSGERAAIYMKHRKLGVAPLSVFGDATRRAVLLASTMLSLKDGGVLLMDEIEAGIHVSVLGRVFEWLVKAARTLKVQVFVTTHSLEALDAIISARSVLGEDDIVAFHLEQTESKTQCKRFSGDLLYRLRFERGLDVR